MLPSVASAHGRGEIEDEISMMMQLGSVRSVCNNFNNNNPLPRWKPKVVEPAPNCPRCASSNTKFCYYNNYSLSQPRYLCKACRRYWTKGGFLRNVPVGGGSRKSRRSHSSALSRRQLPSPSNYITHQHHHDAAVDTGGGSDIDMAVVFAKFLSSGQDSNNGSSSSNNCLTPESVESDAPPQPSDLALVRFQNFTVDDGFMDPLEWEGLLGNSDDQVLQDNAFACTTSSSVDYSIPFDYHPQDSDHLLLPVSDSDATCVWTTCFDF